MVINQTIWREINLLARAYLELQRSRVAFDLRIQKLEESELVEEGLYLKIDTEKVDKKTNKKKRSTVYKPVDKTKGTQKKIAEFLLKLKEENTIYQILLTHKTRIKKQETDLIEDAKAIFQNTGVWDWCLGTRGLGPVASLTFMGYINPAKTPTLGNLWSMCGLTPGSKFRRGEQGHSSPIVKARIWLIAGNTIKAQDPYYSQIYNLKKNYFMHRPDLLAQKEGPGKIKGWQGKMHNYALRVLMKILVSHAYELIMKEYRNSGGKIDSQVAEKLTKEQKKHIVYAKNYVPHRNLLPIRPDDLEEQGRILDSFEATNDRLLKRLQEMWDDPNDTENHEKYFEFLKHAELS